MKTIQKHEKRLCYVKFKKHTEMFCSLIKTMKKTYKRIQKNAVLKTAKGGAYGWFPSILQTCCDILLLFMLTLVRTSKTDAVSIIPQEQRSNVCNHKALSLVTPFSIHRTLNLGQNKKVLYRLNIWGCGMT